MPIIKSAKKKLRQDKKRRKANLHVKEYMKEVLKKFRENPTIEGLSKAFKATDKVAKKNLIHKNKAARMKSSLSKLVSDGEKKEKIVKKPTVTKAKSAAKKSTPKKK